MAEAKVEFELDFGDQTFPADVEEWRRAFTERVIRKFSCGDISPNVEHWSWLDDAQGDERDANVRLECSCDTNVNRTTGKAYFEDELRDTLAGFDYDCDITIEDWTWV